MVLINKKMALSTLVFAGFILSACESQTDVNDEGSTSEAIEEAKVVAEAVSTDSEQELKPIDEIMAWWPGDYNNDAQLEKLRSEGKPVWAEDGSGEGGHIEVTSHYRTVDLPAFGENVLYVEELKHGKPDLVFRQRIYTFYEDEAGQLRVTLWNFKDKEKYVGAWQNLEMIAGLMPEEMSALPAKCDLYVQPKENGKYHMPMNGRDCAFGENYFNYQVLLGPESFWFRDKIVRLEGDEPVSVAGGFTYHELIRVN